MTFLLIAVIAFGLTGLILISVTRILERHFHSQEAGSMYLSIEQVANALDAQLAPLADTTRRLALSDETYAYLADPNPDFSLTHGTPEAFRQFGFDLLVIMDSDGRVLFSGIKAQDGRIEARIPPEINEQVAPENRLTELAGEEGGLRGWMVVDRQPFWVAGYPILRSDGGGPQRGTLLLGKFIDQDMKNRIGEALLLTFDLYRLEDAGDVRQLAAALTEQNPYYVELNATQAMGLAVFTDIFQQRAIILRVERFPTILNNTILVNNSLVISILTITIIFSAILYYLMEFIILRRVLHISREVQAVGANPTARVRLADPGHDEITALANKINEMLDNLEQAAAHSRELLEQVVNGRERLQAVSKRLVEVQEEERRRIALELHDEIGQVLTGLRLSMDMLHSLPPEAAGEHIRRSSEVINETIARVRQMSLDLRPSILDDLGLVPTLLWYFDRYHAQTGIDIHFQQNSLASQRFSPAIEITAYRVVQEALTNIARYAQVKQAEVILWLSQDILGIQVVDEGVGFNLEEVFNTYNSRGLLGIRERVGFLRGQLTIVTQPGEGTSLTVEIPVNGQLERRRHDR
jgi:signal transduction histidine kinase